MPLCNLYWTTNRDIGRFFQSLFKSVIFQFECMTFGFHIQILWCPHTKPFPHIQNIPLHSRRPCSCSAWCYGCGWHPVCLFNCYYGFSTTCWEGCVILRWGLARAESRPACFLPPSPLILVGAVSSYHLQSGSCDRAHLSSKSVYSCSIGQLFVLID